MMGLYIPNAKMPKTCYDECPCQGIHWCNVLKEITEPMTGKRLDGCPLIPVPVHGDLIDYDFCLENYELLHDDDGNPVYAVRMRDINNAPTIIPTSKEGEG